jgi:catechol 2,3-dioxygenase-like lactoylglutathione lyase family enzyme
VATATAREAVKNPPWAFEEVEPNLEILAAERKAGDIVIATPDAEKALLLYADKFGLRGLEYRRAAYPGAQRSCAGRSVRNLPASGRVWVLFYHDHPLHRAGERFLLDRLADRGHVLTAGEEPGSKLLRVDLSRSLPEPELPSACFRPPGSIDFRQAAAARRGLHPLSAEGRAG